MIVDALHQLQARTLDATPQPQEGVSYAAKISKEEAALDFTLPAAVIERKIRALHPFPGAVALFDQVPVKVWQAQLASVPRDAEPGRILQADAEGVLVACGQDGLRLTSLQKPGGKRLPVAEFLKGFPMAGGRFASPSH